MVLRLGYRHALRAAVVVISKGRLRRGMLGPKSLRPAILPRQVEQDLAELGCRQAEVIADGTDLNLLQHRIETHQQPLKNVVGLFPAPHTAKPPQHSVSKLAEPLLAVAQQLLARHRIARAQPIQASLQMNCGGAGHGGTQGLSSGDGAGEHS
jgi:hypothetical protein